MPGIRVKDGESFESALRRFKKKCEKAGIMADLRRHQHFEPSNSTPALAKTFVSQSRARSTNASATPI